MTTNTWVDWSGLPGDVSRRIYKDAISGPGSFDHTRNAYEASPYYGQPIARQGMGNYLRSLHHTQMLHDVQTGEDYHPSAFESRWRYVKPVLNAGIGLLAGGMVLKKIKDETPTSVQYNVLDALNNVGRGGWETAITFTGDKDGAYAKHGQIRYARDDKGYETGPK